ncbi:glucose-6-phosphate dehydrogenase [Dyella sp. EPa41]|uniref:glucose-6-phosphate dehydrogenase n=1 Tax=Dyella sp. EPa41 TaxID=1561194 RepID=UPI001915ADEB|nr:glucose-6-phosphate dehydrogenase [Dyella sp. EPa41]
MSVISSDAFVFFGATGDLAYKMIFPALQALIGSGGLRMPIIGVARGKMTLDQLRERARGSLREHGGIDAVAFDRLAAQMQYIDGDYNDADTYARLKQALGKANHPLHYLAIPPDMFGIVVEGLARSGCATGARIVVEKPFGRDLASAKRLNRILHDVFPESSIFRIDHYLGKEAVENLLYFRFANTFIEPVWSRTHIDNVQITMAENFGIQGRGSFYDDVGALRDVVQNHLLQVTALLAMEAPLGYEPEAMRAEKLRLFQAMRPLKPSQLVRGQFRGYRGERGVAADSSVETFAALRLHIDTWRWAGVPFFIRTGKCLPLTACEVMVSLKEPPLAVFDAASTARTNYFRFRLGPEVTLAVGARVKRAGERMRGESVELLARHRSVGEELPYQRLIGEAIRGDPSRFTSDACVEAAWAVLDPVWDNAGPVHEYAPGSWGPEAADAIASRHGGWHDPKKEKARPC